MSGDEDQEPDRKRFVPMQRFVVSKPGGAAPAIEARVVSVVSEADLVPWRDAEGLCHLVWPRRERAVQYKDFQDTVTWFRSLPKLVGLMPVGTETLVELADGTVVLLAFLEKVPRLPDSREWLFLEHQAGGYACAQIRMVATRLAPTVADRSGFDDLARKLYRAGNGWFADCEDSPEACEMVWEMLGAMGFAAASGGNPCEAFYPVEATPEVLRRLDPDPADLLPLLEHPAAKPMIVVLSNNSD